MSKLSVYDGYPKVIKFHSEKQQKILIMSLLGPDLVEMYKICRCRFTLKTILMLADQMILRLERLHSLGFLHRDIKPENFTVGCNWSNKYRLVSPVPPDANTIFLLDFGLSKSYLHDSGKHIDYHELRGVVGTGRYMSISANEGHEQSRRDDMESLGYVLLFLMKGSLPWQNARADEKKNKYQKILELKKALPLERLCDGSPNEFKDYLRYCRKLDFAATPDYNYLRKLFRTLFHKLEYHDDLRWDWYYIKDQTVSYACPSSFKVTKTAENVDDEASDCSIKRSELRNMEKKVSKIKMEATQTPNRHKTSQFSLQLPLHAAMPIQRTGTNHAPVGSSNKSLDRGPSALTSLKVEKNGPTQSGNPPNQVSEDSSRMVYLPRSLFSNTSFVPEIRSRSKLKQKTDVKPGEGNSMQKNTTTHDQPSMEKRSDFHSLGLKYGIRVGNQERDRKHMRCQYSCCVAILESLHPSEIFENQSQDLPVYAKMLNLDITAGIRA
jgi:serine/threonine protein kinase